ncbi:MAG: hydroxymethylglutaryl-CoA lyase [Bacteroidetes bacterium]|nr:hydroxymethylglutaryl-CoA lyase [Bacteroidota bacterium]
MVKIIECPRDAMQGVHEFIPTAKKVDFINYLLKVGYDTLDFGSFVSPTVVPQLKDTAEVLAKLDLGSTSTKLLAIIANLRGAEEACSFEQISYLGYPFSISETFQQRNTNATIEESLLLVKEVQELVIQYNKELVIYISMGFGNPYGEPWSHEIAMRWIEKLIEMDIKIIALSDTIGIANPESITELFSQLVPAFPNVEFGAHFHTVPDKWEEKIVAAWENGCKRFDAALKGYGGCPMADDDLVGNMPSENLIGFFKDRQIETGLDDNAFEQAMEFSNSVFPLS